MTATIRHAAEFDNGATPATTVTAPAQASVAVGDQLGVWVTSTAPSITFSISGTSGWTAQTPTSGTNGSCCLFTKTADSTDVTLSGSAGSYTITASVSHPMSGIIWAITSSTTTGLDPAASNSGQILAAVSTTIPATGVTTTSNGDLLMWLAFSRVASGAPAAITPPSGFTTAVTQGGTTNASSNVGTYLATAVQATAGATGTETGSQASLTNGGALLLSYAPATAPPPATSALLLACVP